GPWRRSDRHARRPRTSFAPWHSRRNAAGRRRVPWPPATSPNTRSGTTRGPAFRRAPARRGDGDAPCWAYSCRPCPGPWPPPASPPASIKRLRCFASPGPLQVPGTRLGTRPEGVNEQNRPRFAYLAGVAGTDTFGWVPTITVTPWPPSWATEKV